MPDEEIVATEQPTLEPPPAPPSEPAPEPVAPEAPSDKPKQPLDFIGDRVTLARAKMEAGHIDLFPKAAPAPVVEVAPETPLAPPAAETPAAVEAVAQATQQPAQAPAPVVAAPAAPAPADEKKPPFGESWGEYRRLLKSIKAIEAAGGRVEDLLQQRPAAPAPAAPPPAAVVPTSDEDPFGVNKVAADVQAIKDGQAAIQAQQAAIQRDNIINAQIRTFEADHPDYRPALDYLVKSRQDEYRMSGIGDVEGSRLLADTRWQAAIEKAQDILSEKEQRFVTEEEAARELAIELRVNAEANDIINGTLKQNKMVPQVVYELARQRGYQTAPLMPPLVPTAPNGAAPAPAATAPAPSAVAEKIRNEAKKSAAAKSLSNVASATATGGTMPAPIRSLQDLADFRSRVGSQEYQAFIRAQNDRDPRWHLKLTAG